MGEATLGPNSSSGNPILVHCSDGMKCSGVWLALVSLLQVCGSLAHIADNPYNIHTTSMPYLLAFETK
jgi:protein tyrosine phosphatase